jgi:hypothetical protein
MPIHELLLVNLGFWTVSDHEADDGRRETGGETELQAVDGESTVEPAC